MGTLSERAVEAREESEKLSKEIKESKERKMAKILEELLRDSLETPYPTHGKNEVEIDGLRFQADELNSNRALYLITPCEGCGKDNHTEVRGLEDLGYYIKNPQKYHDGCDPKEKVTESPAGDRLVEIIKEIVLETKED